MGPSSATLSIAKSATLMCLLYRQSHMQQALLSWGVRVSVSMSQLNRRAVTTSNIPSLFVSDLLKR